VSRPNRAEAPSVATTTRLSPAERKRVGQAAAANHQSVSQFSRDALMDAAEECLADRRAAFRTTKLHTGTILVT
jgi:uncharacterized protein (DUF1778 family)